MQLIWLVSLLFVCLLFVYSFIWENAFFIKKKKKRQTHKKIENEVLTQMHATNSTLKKKEIMVVIF